MKHLTLEQKIGQMIVVRASGHLCDRQIRYPAWEPPNAQLREWLETLYIGGVILLGGSVAEISLRTQQLQSWAKRPLVIAADIEEGVGQRFAGATWFPPPMALGEIAQKNLSLGKALAKQMGEITAKEALTIGINWLLAPVVDVNNNHQNPVINVRAFSDDPELVGELAKAYIAGAKSYPVLTTAKHFPGHGDTTSDSHLDLPVITHDAERLQAIEIPPFKAAISAKVDSIMTGHLQIPAWDNQRPATLSPKILGEQLRQTLGFEGLIVSDALMMGGVTKFADPKEVAIMAVEAGVDVLLMPPNPALAIKAIAAAVKSGRIDEAQIERSVNRIWQAKQGLNDSFDTFTGSLLSQLSQPEATAVVNCITTESNRLGENFPVAKVKQGRNLVVVDDLLNCEFLDRQSPVVTIPTQLGYELQLVDSHTLNLLQDDGSPTVLQAFIRGNPFRGAAGLTQATRQVYSTLLQSPQFQGLILYGSPYVLDWFREQLPPDVPWIFSYGQASESQAIAVRQLFDLSEVPQEIADTF